MNDTTRPITPIFIFSLPRSGSTLTQRILATHAAVATASEPWILLPFIYGSGREGLYAEYGHRVALKAIEDFCESLPGGRSDYLGEIGELALRLYARSAKGNARFFVDKTPRYHVICAEILRLFAEGKFVFLWRNPLAIISSIIETWGKGRWNIYEFDFDLFDGLESLVEACRKAGNRACSVRYEEIVGQGSEARRRLFSHIGLEFDDSRAAQISSVQLPGRMGDQTGTGLYFALSDEPMEKWKKTLESPIRKMWCRRYLGWIGEERLKVMGYDIRALLRDLDSIPTRPTTMISDIARMFFGLLVRTCEPWIVRDKLIRLSRGKRLHAHS
jgi:sulfotransferase family protein